MVTAPGGGAFGVNINAHIGCSGSQDSYTSHQNALFVAGDMLSTFFGNDTAVAGVHLFEF